MMGCNSMIRGTTPAIQFIFPFDVGTISALEIYLSQDVEPVITKKLEDFVQIDSNTLSTVLTQEETLSLDSSLFVYIQARCNSAGNIIASDIIRTTIGRLLSNEVME